MAVAFAGPLCRWFAARAGAADLARLRGGVEAWRADLRAAVADKVRAQLEWDEGSALAREFDLGDAGWTALRLFALYAEQPELELPDATPPLLELDPAWRSAADAKFARSNYGQLLACSVWLPGEFPVTLRAPLPDGETAELGSLGALAAQLHWLNERTFQADAAAIAAWREVAAPTGGALIPAARRGYAALLAAVECAQAARLPVVVRAA